MMGPILRRTALALGAACLATGAFAQTDSTPAENNTAENNTLLIDVEGAANGTITIELLPEIAPLHVARIKELAEAGAYDGVAFHRVIEGFMAQTGDVEHGTREMVANGRAGMGGSDLPDLPAEFSAEPFERGTLGMARSQNPNSANSQFFIMFAEGAFLNGQYTVFGRVTDGMEIVDQIQRGAGQSGSVANPDFMTSVRLAPAE